MNKTCPLRTTVAQMTSEAGLKFKLRARILPSVTASSFLFVENRKLESWDVAQQEYAMIFGATAPIAKEAKDATVRIVREESDAYSANNFSVFKKLIRFKK